MNQHDDLFLHELLLINSWTAGECQLELVTTY